MVCLFTSHFSLVPNGTVFNTGNDVREGLSPGRTLIGKRVGIEPATFQSQVQRRNYYATRPLSHAERHV